MFANHLHLIPLPPLYPSVPISPLCPLFTSQLIYKKYNLPCPMPFMYHHTNHSMNGTALGPHALHNGTVLMDMSPASYLDGHHTSGVHFEPHPDDVEEMCTPKYFVFNSQVSWLGVELLYVGGVVEACGWGVSAYMCVYMW